MKKIFCYTFFCLQCLLVSTSLVGQVKYQKLFGGFGGSGRNIVKNVTGGYIVATDHGGFGLCLMQLDHYGDTLWTQNYSQSMPVFGDLIETSDGGYIISGTFYIQHVGILIKTDGNGNIVFKRLFTNFTGLVVNSIEQCSDGGYFIVGNKSNLEGFVIKTNSNGDPLWTKTYSNTYNYSLNKIKRTSDGGGIIVGSSVYPLNNNAFATLMKIDSSGNVVWQKLFEGIYCLSKNTLESTTDGGYIIAGTSYFYNDTAGGDGILYLIKMNSLGNFVWGKCYPDTKNSIYGIGVTSTTDNGYTITSGTNAFTSVDNSQYRVLLINTDSSGIPNWSKIYGGNGFGYGNSVCQTNDNGFIISGNYRDSVLNENFYLIKTDAIGNSGCTENTEAIIANPFISNLTFLTPIVATYNLVTNSNSLIISPVDSIPIQTICSSVTKVNEETIKEQLLIYPNPSSGLYTINLESSVNDDAVINVFNLLGEKITNQKVKTKFGVNKYQLDLTNAPDGIYFVTLNSNTRVSQKKFVVLK